MEESFEKFTANSMASEVAIANLKNLSSQLSEMKKLYKSRAVSYDFTELNLKLVEILGKGTLILAEFEARRKKEMEEDDKRMREELIEKENRINEIKSKFSFQKDDEEDDEPEDKVKRIRNKIRKNNKK